MSFVSRKPPPLLPRQASSCSSWGDPSSLQEEGPPGIISRTGDLSKRLLLEVFTSLKEAMYVRENERGTSGSYVVYRTPRKPGFSKDPLTWEPIAIRPLA